MGGMWRIKKKKKKDEYIYCKEKMSDKSIYEGFRKNGNRDGIWMHTDSNGNPKYCKVFEHGYVTNTMLIKQTNEETVEDKETISKQKVGKDSDYTYCIENHAGEYAHGYRKNGQMTGIWVFRDAIDTGNILRSSVYMNGKYIKDLEIK